MAGSRRAIISDIHGNLEALQAVLQHIESQNASEIYCLGDIIGYGPNPLECIDTVMARCSRTILGNHDQAVVFDPAGFNPVAYQAIMWTREMMESDQCGTDLYNRRWDFIGELPRRHDEGQVLFVHGSPRDPTNEYIFPELAFDSSSLALMMKRFEQSCLHGHTHIAGVITESARWLPPEDIDYRFRLGSEKALINVGSVGQPRDEDNRACYVVLDLDEGVVEYHRVAYDFERTRQKIYDNPHLDNMLGDRLTRGS